MIELFVDTETTGFIHRNLPLNDDKQPHLVQIAMILRENGKDVGQASSIVHCPIEVPDGAYKVHGIDQKTTHRLGVSPYAACKIFYEWWSAADVMVAHNASFDRQILEIAFTKMKLSFPWHPIMGEHKPWACTMEAAEPFCKIPATEKQIKAGFKKQGDFKQPKLEEAVKILLGRDHEGAHDAMHDVRACADLYEWLQAEDREAAK